MTSPTEAKLSRLTRIELREAWTSESGDFTPWLATPENLELLAETLGLELELEAQEKDVGPFRADLLCKEIGTDHWVLIENQLERTDHTHLGQLMTYAAGLKAVTVVWISSRFTEEHRAALDWLNEITGGQFNFFGVEVELWRIGDSPVAPKFNVVCKPNDWSKRLTDTVKRGPERSDEVEFFSALANECSPADEQIARDLLRWAEKKALEKDFTKNRYTVKFTPVVPHGNRHYLFTLRADGMIHMQLGQLKNYPPFLDPCRREQVLERIKNVPDVVLTEKAVGGFPAFPLASLKDRRVLVEFVSTLDWMVQEIRACPEQPQTDPQNA